jgi:hypothetical protein
MKAAARLGASRMPDNVDCHNLIQMMTDLAVPAALTASFAQSTVVGAW